MRPSQSRTRQLIRSRLLAPCLGAAILAIALSGCGRKSTVTVQVDVSKAVALSNKARSPDAQTRTPFSAFTIAAGLDGILDRVVEFDEFRALPLASRFTDDDTKHTRAVQALAEICACSVRADPAAIRFTITAASPKDAETLATLIAKATRYAAANGASADLTERRDLEHRSEQTLEDRAQDFTDTLARLRDLADHPADKALPQTSRQALESASGLEMLSHELASAKIQSATQHAIARQFDLLAAEPGEWATSFIVPAGAEADPAFKPLVATSRSGPALALADPVKGKDWLTYSLSISDRALPLTVGAPEVRGTSWMKSFRSPAAFRDSDPIIDSRAAISDLANRIVVTPIGDGSVVELDLSGTFTPDDRRTILNALASGVIASRTEATSVDVVGRREQLDQRIQVLHGRLHDFELTASRRAEEGSIAAQDISSLFEASDLGRDVQRTIDDRDALDAQRHRLALQTDPLFRDVVLVRSAR